LASFWGDGARLDEEDIMTDVPPADPAPEDGVNPYAAPDAPIGATVPKAPADLAADEAVRRAHLNHEANIRSVGELHTVVACLAFFGICLLAPSLASGRDVRAEFAVFIVTFVLNVALAMGLGRLQPWARWTDLALVSSLLLSNLAACASMLATGVAVAASVLVASAIGWAVMGFILYLLLSPKSATVFSPEYKGVIARTPHTKYRTSCAAKAALAAVLILVFFVILRAMLS
jgi:hypothetical protein